MSNIDRALSQIRGRIGIAAKQLDSLECLNHCAGESFFTASTFKVPILAEIYRAIDEGRIFPDERLELRDELRAPGSGVLKKMETGLRLTIKDLVMLMIIISDNTATDMLYGLIGRTGLDKAMVDFGLTSTRLPMSCRELLYSVCGVETDDITTGNIQVTDMLKSENIVLDSEALSENHGNISSPRDMIHILEIIYTGSMHSQESRVAMMDILSSQQLRTIIPYALPASTYVAHKTGGFPSVRCDVGIVLSPSGPYTVAIMAKEVIDMRSIDRSLADISRAIYDIFNPSYHLLTENHPAQ